MPDYLAEPSGPATAGVLVVHDWYGLPPHVRASCDELAVAGLAALARPLTPVGRGQGVARRITVRAPPPWPPTWPRPAPSPPACRSSAPATSSGSTPPDTYRPLVLERGWTLDEWERWFAASLAAVLLPDEGAAPPGSPG